MKPSEDRSGSSLEWVSGLGALTPEDCRAYLDSLMGIDLKECDNNECDQVAIYRVSFHGCEQLTVCGLHRALLAADISRKVQYQGSIWCQICNKYAYCLADAMQWHAI